MWASFIQHLCSVTQSNTQLFHSALHFTLCFHSRTQAHRHTSMFLTPTWTALFKKQLLSPGAFRRPFVLLNDILMRGFHCSCQFLLLSSAISLCMSHLFRSQRFVSVHGRLPADPSAFKLIAFCVGEFEVVSWLHKSLPESGFLQNGEQLHYKVNPSV